MPRGGLDGKRARVRAVGQRGRAAPEQARRWALSMSRRDVSPWLSLRGKAAPSGPCMNSGGALDGQPGTRAPAAADPAAANPAREAIEA